MGYAMRTLGKGLNVYIDTHYASLMQSAPRVSGVADALHPKAEELIQLINIQGIAPAPTFLPGASYKFQITYPDSCKTQDKVSDKNCRPVGLAYIDKPLMHGRKVDYVALGRAVRIMKNRGGYSRAEDPSHFTFPARLGAGVPAPAANPVNKAGLLAWRDDISPPANVSTEFLRTDGSNRMNASLGLDGKNIQHDLRGAKDISASRMIIETLALSGNESVQGNVVLHKDSLVEGNKSVTGSLTAEKETRTTGIDSGRADVKGELLTENEKLLTTRLNVNQDAVFNNNLEVRKGAKFFKLYLSPYHRVSETCSPKWALGLSRDNQFIYCNHQGKWTYWNHKPKPKVMDHVTIYYWSSEFFYNPTVTFDRHLYCRSLNKYQPRDLNPVKRANGVWEAKANWMAGDVRVLCFG